MPKYEYDIIVIGSGSGGLSVGLFMNKAGFSVLMISKSDNDIGGDCLNDGCVPSKALLHVASIIHNAGLAREFGLQTSGKPDFNKVMGYVKSRQEIIREHENAYWLREQGIDVALGKATFTGKNTVEVEGQKYSADKIVIATGSTPAGLFWARASASRRGSPSPAARETGWSMEP
jgi:pyruvate/2-oxoglutarate dehydrogenase complex dihydrolipoamide dehydrogenase (E3) component